MSSIRALSDDRLTVRLGYSHMSSLAINMYLARLVYNRSAGTTLAAIGASSVENNLTVLRTGRDEGRVTLDSRFFRRLGGFVEGRVRARSLINGESVPDVYSQRTTPRTPRTLRATSRSGCAMRAHCLASAPSLIYSLIFDYRAQNHVVSFDVGVTLERPHHGIRRLHPPPSPGSTGWQRRSLLHVSRPVFGLLWQALRHHA